jgi:hypothetical protein
MLCTVYGTVTILYLGQRLPLNIDHVQHLDNSPPRPLFPRFQFAPQQLSLGYRDILRLPGPARDADKPGDPTTVTSALLDVVGSEKIIPSNFAVDEHEPLLKSRTASPSAVFESLTDRPRQGKHHRTPTTPLPLPPPFSRH